MTTSRNLAIGCGVVAAAMLIAVLLCGGCSLYYSGQIPNELGLWSGHEPFESPPFEAKTGDFVIAVSVTSPKKPMPVRAVLVDAAGTEYELFSETVSDTVNRMTYPKYGPGTYRLKVEADGVAWSCKIDERRG